MGTAGASATVVVILASVKSFRSSLGFACWDWQPRSAGRCLELEFLRQDAVCAHGRLQRRWNQDAAIRLLEILDDRYPRAPTASPLPFRV